MCFSECFPGLRSRTILGGVGYLTTLRVGVEFFCPTPDVQLDHFLHHPPKFGIPAEMVQFPLKPLLKQISCCPPRFPPSLTAKFHPLYVKELESENLEKSELGVGNFAKSESGVGNFGKVGVGVGYFTSDLAILVVLVIKGFSIDIHIRIHYHFSTLFSECWLVAPTVASVLPSAKVSHPGSNL